MSFTVLAGCVTTERDSPTTSVTAKEIKITAGTQGQFGKLPIAVWDPGKEDYTDAGGKTSHGPTAGLYLHLNTTLPVEKQMAVYAGKTVEVEGYMLFVTEISKRTSGGHITLIVQELSQASAH